MIILINIFADPLLIPEQRTEAPWYVHFDGNLHSIKILLLPSQSITLLPSPALHH